MPDPRRDGIGPLWDNQRGVGMGSHPLFETRLSHVVTSAIKSVLTQFNVPGSTRPPCSQIAARLWHLVFTRTPTGTVLKSIYLLRLECFRVGEGQCPQSLSCENGLLNAESVALSSCYLEIVGPSGGRNSFSGYGNGP
jgi:hypothetical protein